ncbi:MAG: LysR family transcriptional regulator [Erysipelotrichaceae bacterium]|nr:LysR family transcriptional regulator [Erysipelotrichaceae bacterium]
MEIRVLNYFLTVVREGSITKAADVLHMTQPTLSRQLSAMEEELGVKLFRRGSRKITLTEQGIQLKKRAEEILQLVEKTKEEVTLGEEQQIRHLMIGCSRQFNPEKAAVLINEIMNYCPYTSVELVEESDEVLAEKIEAGILDGAFMQSGMNGAKYDSIEIYSRKPAVWVNSSHPLAEKDEIHISDLYGYPLITPTVQQGNEWSKTINSRKAKRNGMLITSHSLGREVLAQNDRAVMIWPSWHSSRVNQREILEKTLADGPESSGYFTWNKENAGRISMFLKKIFNEISSS